MKILPEAPTDYRYIRAWGRLLHSHASYIQDQIRHARADGAPQTAIYVDSNGKWRTVDDVTNTSTRRQLREMTS